ncbi:MAG TPA: protoporphyrinogen oxidase [Thermoanaerobaculia bacterium]|nr:protoporphyrinogen oxidase [Thermoanaerobaculia bacterium]
MTTAVVGGGLSGLVRAHALLARGEPVLLFEEADQPGGVVRTERQDGFLLELGPNTVRPTAELWSLVQTLGLEKDALLADPRTPRFIDFGGRLHEVPSSPGGLAKSRILSARGKLRLLAEPFVRQGDPATETVADFFARRLGHEVAERLVEPFVSGIWGGRGDRLSVAHAFPLLARWESTSGGIARGGISAMRNRPKNAPRGKRGLLSFREGLTTLPRRLAAELGARARFGSRVESIRQSNFGWTLSVAGQDVSAERVCIAAPAREAARLADSFAPEAAGALRTIPSAPLVVLHLASSERPRLSGFGHLVVPQEGRRILGAIWSSSLFAGRAPEGRALFTVFLGGARDPEALRLTDGALVDVASRDLRAVGLPRSLETIRVTRYTGAIPQYDAGHGERIETLASVERRQPGVFFLGNYRGGISVGDVVRSALLLPN